jgi:hypothetical protein
MIGFQAKGGSMERKDDSVKLDMSHLEKVSRRVGKLLRKECRDAIEAMYVLKGNLYVLRRSLNEEGVVLDNEDELDGELRSMIDKAIRGGE